MSAAVCYAETSEPVVRVQPSDRQSHTAKTLRPIIEQTVADVFDIDVEAMRRPTRGLARIALARQVAMYLAHVGSSISLTEVGHLFNRDRTTVAYACEVVETRRDNGEFDRAIELIELVIRVRVGVSTHAR